MGTLLVFIPMRLFTMIYVSCASTKVTGHSLRDIADNSATRNSRIGVTGLLLYGSGNYFQIVEGGETAVKGLYRRIAQDSRHHNLRVLFESPISDRIFPQWQMGQLNLDEPGITPADYWTELEQPASLNRLDQPSSRDRAIAWVREFIEHHSDSQKYPSLTGT